MEKTILAIDPGTRKCGFALVQRNTEGKLSLLWRTIKPTEEASSAMHEAMNVANYSMVVVGKGTSSKELVSKLREEFPSIGVLMVDEENTSMQARERYWEHHARKGWRRFVPSTLQTPPEPIDDFAALILAERVLL